MAEINIARRDGADAAHGHDHGHGHAPHHDVSDDKGAAYLGLFGGAILLGAFLFGMVTWTNHHLGGHEGGAAAAATSTK